jgi:outer membrane immunogenic protein
MTPDFYKLQFHSGLLVIGEARVPYFGPARIARAIQRNIIAPWVGGNVKREQDSAGRHHGEVMKNPTIAIAAIAVVIGTRALAADVEVKAPLPPVPVYSWTGFYLGGNVGYSWGNADTNFNIKSASAVSYPAIPGFVGSEPAKPKGIIGGGQFGYNSQFSSNWIAGLEADIQGSGEKAGNNFGNSFSPLIMLFSPTDVTLTEYAAKIPWFGTVRGRIGYAWDWIMLYATGGLAYGTVQLQGTQTFS